MILSVNINPMIPLSKQLRYLNKEEQEIIKNNNLPKDINYELLINKYCPELENINNIFNNNKSIINTNNLTKEFVCGLFDGDGSLNIRLINNKTLATEFEIIQDKYNKDILDELLIFFNNSGNIKYHKTQNSVSYLNYSTVNIYNIIIPKLLGINNINEIDINNLSNLYIKSNGPKIKLYKIYNFIKIYELLLNNNINNKDIFDKALILLYNNSYNPKNYNFEK